MLVATLAACVSNSVEQRRQQSTQLALDAGWQKLVLDTTPFKMAAFVPPNIVKSASLTVYIEGDGMAWVNSTTPSFDPTPRDPLALRLALSDATGHAVYLARPCQYVMEENPQQCTQKYWTSDRFSPEVIAASNQAINLLKARYTADHIILIGYSGGGAVAALIAARRTDIQKLVTVVGNLDTTYWTTTRKLSPLSGSLNPANVWRALQNIPQQHFVGARDKVLGEDVARAYAKHFDELHQPVISVYPAFDHHCCWESVWPNIVKNNFLPVN